MRDAHCEGDTPALDEAGAALVAAGALVSNAFVVSDADSMASPKSASSRSAVAVRSVFIPDLGSAWGKAPIPRPVNRNRAAAEKPLLVQAYAEWFTHFAY